LLPAFDVVTLGERRFVPLACVAPALDTGIHSGNVRAQLFYRDQPPCRTLPRLLQGTQVVRYGTWWDHPAARYRYVDLDFRPDRTSFGVGRGGQPSGRRAYWHFCGPIEHHHVRERLLMRQTADEPFVGYIEQGDEHIYTDNTLHTLLLTPAGHRYGLTYLYVLAVLNSAALRRIYRTLAQEDGRVLAQVKTTLVNRLPIALPTAAERAELEAYVRRIQQIQRDLPLSTAAQSEMTHLQTQIDARLDSIYTLAVE